MGISQYTMRKNIETAYFQHVAGNFFDFPVCSTPELGVNLPQTKDHGFEKDLFMNAVKKG